MDESIKGKAIFGFIWRFLQNAGTQIISFIISIVLARVLMPEDYGLVAMITVFTGIAMVFINTGFSSAIVQRKNLTDEETSTVFYFSIGMGILMYGILYFAAPYIAQFYSQPKLVSMLRVESFIVIIGSLYSVPQALINRRMQFKKSFIVSLSGVLVQGIVGITLAYSEFGPWALIYATLANYAVNAIIMWIVVRWIPKLCFSVKAFSGMFMFSLKMLLSALFDTVFNNIRSIIIGWQYTSADLAYYNRGYQFPSLLMTQIDSAITTVLFSSLSKFQDDWERGIMVLRRAMKTSMYVCLPLIAGLCAVARPMVSLLLTDKWLPCVDYIRITAILCASWPLSARRHALNSLGKSGISLILNIMGKIITLAAIFITYKHSVKALIIGTVVASYIGQIVATVIYAKALKYPVIDQIKDILPSVLLSVFMGVCVWSISLLQIPDAMLLVIQVAAGVVIYIALSKVFKMESFNYTLNMVKSILNKKANG